MYITGMCFNVSICFKMGSLLLWYNNKLVYPPELSRITGFCTNSNKNFWGRTPRPLFLAELFEPAQISPSTIFLANSKSNGLCMSYLKSPLLIIFSWMDVWTNKEKSLKTPWKCTSKVLEKSLKKVCHDLWEPWTFIPSKLQMKPYEMIMNQCQIFTGLSIFIMTLYSYCFLFYHQLWCQCFRIDYFVYWKSGQLQSQ